jgi:hypothetical protein
MSANVSNSTLWQASHRFRLTNTTPVINDAQPTPESKLAENAAQSLLQGFFKNNIVTQWRDFFIALIKEIVL